MKRMVAKLSEARTEELYQQREHLDSTSIVVTLDDTDRETVLKVLSLLDTKLRRTSVDYTITPPEGFVSTFYGFELDLWSE